MSMELTPHIESLIYASFHGEMSSQQREELSAWVAASPEHARFYYAYALDERSIDRVLRGEQLGSVALKEAVLGEDKGVGEDELATSAAVWSQVVDDALAARQRSELEDNAQKLLQADQAEARRLRMYENRRREMDARATETRALVVPKWALLASAAAVGLAVVLAVAGVFEPGKPTVTQAPPAVAPPRVRSQPSVGPAVVAVVDSALDARWASGSGPVGGELLPGDYELEAGLVRLSYDHGVSLVVQAPARFRVRDAKHLSLGLGRISAVVPTAEGHGFTVTTPELEVVDLGTEFGVVVGMDGVSETHVYRGRVVADVVGRSRRAGMSRHLSAGDATRVREGVGALERVAADELAVVRDEEFAVYERAAEGSTYDRWLAWSYAVRRDPTVFAYYAFDNQDENDSVLLNRAAATSGTLDGQFGNPRAFPYSAPQWAVGRWAGKDALQFRASERDHIVIPRREAAAFDDLEQVTIACWVRVEDPTQVHHLVTKREFEGDSLNFAWVGEIAAAGEGQRPYSILGNFRRPSAGQGWADFESPSVLRNTSGWALLAVSYDGQTVRFYLDGEPAGSYRYTAGIQDTNADLLIGGAAVHLQQPLFLDGVMDEMVIWGRALDDAEVRAMYDAGRPDQGGRPTD